MLEIFKPLFEKAFPDVKDYNNTQRQDLETEAFISGLSVALKEFMLSSTQQPTSIWDAADKAQQKQTLLEQFVQERAQATEQNAVTLNIGKSFSNNGLNISGIFS